MPKNERDQIVCVNHPNQLLGNKTYVSFPKMAVIDNRFTQVNESFPAELLFCQICGYIELNTLRPDENIQNEILRNTEQ